MRPPYSKSGGTAPLINGTALIARPKTVLQIIPHINAGGAERTVVDVGEALVKAGWRSLVASEGGRLVSELEAGGSTHITLPLGSKNPLTLWRNRGRLMDLVKSEGVDIIHARSRAPAWSGYFTARATGTAFVTTYHGAYGQSNRAKALYNSVMGKAHVIIANSRWTGDLVAARHPEAAERIVPINRGTDFAQFAPDAIALHRSAAVAQQWGLDGAKRRLQEKHIGQAPLVILLLGRMTTLKGHELVIEAASRLKDTPLLFVFAGDAGGRDAYRARLVEQIERHGLQDNFLLPGHCADPAAAITLCDALLSASTKAETFGRTVVEASALEKPVLASRIGAVVESLVEAPESARTGFLFTPNDGTALTACLKRFATLSAQERLAMGERGRAFVVPRFSLQSMCEQTLSVYRRVLASER
ncbi:MAG: glycosyltransferase family 4 protein [Pseudomonadota bacterium]